MMTSVKGLLAIVAISLPVAAFAQSGDAYYCRALVAKYDAYLNQSQKRGWYPQDVTGRVAVEKCRAGDSSGISDIERALLDAKFNLPPHA